MCHATYETTHVTVLYELGHALSDVIDETHGVSQEVHGAQNLRCLADQLLQRGNVTSAPCYGIKQLIKTKITQKGTAEQT